jgi:hypothetical protein
MHRVKDMHRDMQRAPHIHSNAPITERETHTETYREPHTPVTQRERERETHTQRHRQTRTLDEVDVGLGVGGPVLGALDVDPEHACTPHIQPCHAMPSHHTFSHPSHHTVIPCHAIHHTAITSSHHTTQSAITYIHQSSKTELKII